MTSTDLTRATTSAAESYDHVVGVVHNRLDEHRGRIMAKRGQTS